MPPTEPTNLVASTKCIKVFTFNYGWKVNKMNILDNTVQAKLQCFSQTGRNLCLCLIRVIIPCVTTEQSQKQRSTKKFSNIHNKLCGDSIAYSNKDYKRKHWELILLCFFFCQEKKTRFWINIIHLPPPKHDLVPKWGSLIYQWAAQIQQGWTDTKLMCPSNDNFEITCQSTTFWTN